jgi:hypothetical protein
VPLIHTKEYQVRDISDRNKANVIQVYLLKRIFLPSALNVRQGQDKKEKSTILEVSVSNSEVSTHTSISSLNADPSSSKTNEHQLIPVDIRPFPKRTRKSKSRVSAILTHIPIKNTFTETKGKP